MKKIALTILITLILTPLVYAVTLYTVTFNGVIVGNPFIPNTWYINPSGSNLNNGKTILTPWVGINWNLIRPGDTIYVCGTFNTPLTISASGTINYGITIDGNCPSNPGVIDGANIITSSWSSAGSNVYSTPETVALKAVSYGIVAEDGTPLVGIGWKGDSATTITAMVAFGNGTWSYDATNEILYVLTSAADNPTGHTMEASYGNATSSVLTDSKQSYITIQNLTIQNAANYGMSFSNATNITVQNNTIRNTSDVAIITTNVTNYTASGNTIINQLWKQQSPINPTNWYVSSAGAGLNNGTSQGNAWAIGGLNWNSMAPGDTLYVCGTINSSLNIPLSGVNGYPTFVRGDCPGNAGILDGANTIVSSWTLVSSNVYSTPETTGVNGIVTEDDSALVKVAWNTDAPTTIAAMVAYGPGTWSYDSINQILYVLTTGADDPTGHTMEASYGQQYSTLISATNQSYLTIENLTMKNAGDYGLDITGGSNNIINNDTIYNIFDWGAFISGVTNMVMHDNIMHHLVWAGHLPIQQAVGEGIRYTSSTGGSIYNNTISYCPSAGIDLYTNPTGGISVYGNTIHDNLGTTNQYAAGIYSDNSQNNNIYGNLVYNWMVGISLNGEGTGTFTSGTSVYNNLIYNYYYSGIYLGGGSGWTSSENNFFYNNTIVFGPSAYIYSQAVSVQGSQNDTFKNNIVYGNMYIYTNGSQTLHPGYFDYNQYLNSSFSGNVYTSFALWQAANEDAHGATSSPSLGSVFVNAPSLNFELVAASAPIGSGVNLYSIFTTDYDGGARQSSGPWDVGAYVYP